MTPKNSEVDRPDNLHAAVWLLYLSQAARGRRTPCAGRGTPKLSRTAARATEAVGAQGPVSARSAAGCGSQGVAAPREGHDLQAGRQFGALTAKPPGEP